MNRLVSVFLGSEPSSDSKLVDDFHENTKLTAAQAAPWGAARDAVASLNRDVHGLHIAETEAAVATGGKRYLTAERQPLGADPPLLRSVGLTTALERRASRRAYAPGMPDQRAVSALCRYSMGWNPTRSQPEVDGPFYRFAPSSGRLFPLEMYLLLRDQPVAGRPPAGYGLWHFDPSGEALEKLHPLSLGAVRAAFEGLSDDGPPLIVVLTGVLPRLTWKYGPRAYRYLLLEAGHVAQNLLLVAAALDLAACPVVSFVDDRVHDLLDVDGFAEIALYTFFLGLPPAHTAPRG